MVTTALIQDYDQNNLFGTILKGSFSINRYKVGCVFHMVIVSMRLHAEIGRNNHREGAPHFRKTSRIIMERLKT